MIRLLGHSGIQKGNTDGPGRSRRRGWAAVRSLPPFLASDSLSADWHFLFLSPHGGTGLPTASAFACLHFQTPRDRLTSFVGCTSQILGESSDWPVGSGAYGSTNGTVPRAGPWYQPAVPAVAIGHVCGRDRARSPGHWDLLPEMRLGLR